MSHTVEAVEPILRTTKGILDVKWLDREARTKVAEIENRAQSEVLSGSGGYYNEGVINVLDRECVCVVLNNNAFRHATSPSLFWVAGDVVIGEEVTDPEHLRALVKQDNIKILKKNFVLYFDRMKTTRGQVPVFVIRGLPFPEIEGVTGVRDVLSASPIGSVDIYLKERFGWSTEARDLGTILIGFNLA
ncbi:MAG TPA: hypothetical protein VMW06_04415 [Desulfobacterales bacterium]|nr:hypothetical protein [Desulfobacterales bacterium]